MELTPAHLRYLLAIYEVSQINEYIKLRFDDDAFLNNLFLRGEISKHTDVKAFYE